MEFVRIDSSMIQAVAYDEMAQELWVIFNSSKSYVYEEVPKEVYAELLASSSKGSYMVNSIIDCYPYHLAKRTSRRSS